LPCAGLLNYKIGDGVAQSVQCLTTEWTAGVRSPADEMTFPLAYVSRPVLSSSFLSNGSRESLSRGKARTERDAYHSHHLVPRS
jgi:hypothetical protein